MPLDYAAIGGRLQARRKELGITQEDAAERAGITVVYLSKIENGRVHPTLDLLDRLCCVLEYDLARAFTGVQTTSPDYGQEQVLRLFNACAPRVKPVVLHLLEQLAGACAGAGPEGLDIREFSCGETGYDRDSRLLKRPAQAVCTACLYAVTEPGGAFLDFEVRGESHQ